MQNIQNKNNDNIALGRFLISPMSQKRCDGAFDALVSLRSGRGMASTDRVLRFSATFKSAQAAVRYARTEGVAWARRH